MIPEGYTVINFILSSGSEMLVPSKEYNVEIESSYPILPHIATLDFLAPGFWFCVMAWYRFDSQEFNCAVIIP
jgi:hypothetical protein